MEGNKKFELNDEILDEVAGGFDAPGDYVYKSSFDRHCYSCYQQRRMKLYINNGSGETIMICTECGEKYYNMY